MKFTILINQQAIASAGFVEKTDLVDWAVLDYIFSWSSNPKAKTKNGHIWLDYKYLIQQMPLLKIKTKQSVANRIKKLEKLKLLTTFQHEDNSRKYVRTTDVYFQAVHFEERGVPENGQGKSSNLAQTNDLTENNPDNEGVPENRRGVPENGHRYNHHYASSSSSSSSDEDLEKLKPDQQSCYQWATKTSTYWSTRVTNIAQFYYFYNNNRPQGLKAQYNEYLATQANKSNSTGQYHANNANRPATRKLSLVEQIRADNPRRPARR